MIYLDNAATTWPKPPQVRREVLRGLGELGANPGRGGYAMSLRTGEALFRCRQMAAELFGAPGPDCVIFQSGCTQALNLVIKGMLRPGDHAVISDLEHNAVLRPLEKLSRQGVEYTVAKTVPGDSVGTMQGFREAMRPNTKLVVCTHASNVWGFRLPVERIAALAHQYGAKLCVDAAQSAGLLPIRMAESGIDFLCVPGHKGLYGPMGTGLLLLGDPSFSLDTLVEGGTGVNSRERTQPAEPPERYEAGTVNVPGLLGLRAGMEFVFRREPERLWRQELALTARLYDRLSHVSKVRLYTPRPEEPWFLPLLSFNVEGLAGEEAAERLSRQGIAVRAGLHCAPLAHEKLGTEDGAVRLSLSAFTTAGEIESVAGAIARL